ncbi:MAG: helix-turn-helix transcriptional regulator [Anaerolineaceae bacterium]|nr:helix-turn-helix transcriptional regulator [Anaerolineaceae bacterium]
MPPDSELSGREREVAALLLQGKSNKQIAFDLGVSVRTVEYHLSRIYAKLGVSSRAAAVLKLNAPPLRESPGQPGGVLRESTVDPGLPPPHNGGSTAFPWRFPMKKWWLWLLVLVFLAILCVCLLLPVARYRVPIFSGPAATVTEAVQAAPPVPIATVLASATPAPRTDLRQEIQALAAEYDQAVQAERRSAPVQTGRDPHSGEETFLFQGEALERILKLYDRFGQQLHDLNEEYLALYRAEAAPTPFPTRPSAAQNEAYSHQLEAGYQSLLEQELEEGDTLLVYDPAEGQYVPMLVGDSYARLELYARALGVLQQAPLAAQVDPAADVAAIRQALGDPDLQLLFQDIRPLANAPAFQAAVYTGPDGGQYWVEMSSGRLVEMEMNSHLEVPAFEAQDVEQLRAIAAQFVQANALRLEELQGQLAYEESGKGSIYFFRWDLRGLDWSGTEWEMMPPLLQVGVRADGQVVAYLNTLDLYDPEAK